MFDSTKRFLSERFSLLLRTSKKDERARFREHYSFKNGAESILSKCVAGEECQNHLVPIEKFRQKNLVTALNSRQYQNYVYLCHANFNLHAGWLICKYVLNGFCTISKDMFEFETRKGGTNRFGNHMKRHANSNGDNITFNRNLPQKYAKKNS